MNTAKQTVLYVTDQGYWSKGSTMAEAYQNLKYKRGQCTVSIVIGDDAAYVDNAGYICYSQDAFRIYLGTFKAAPKPLGIPSTPAKR